MLSVLIKPVSGMCNMQCDYCFYGDETKKRDVSCYGFMTDATLKNVIRKTILEAKRSVSYVYQGGEPTLRGIDFFRQVIGYQQKYNQNHVFVSNCLQTNGYALNEEWCEFLRENKFLVGLSVDGTERIHNKYRHGPDHKPTYQQVFNTAKMFDWFQVQFNILTVVTPEIAENPEEVYEFYKRNGWNYQQYIPCYEPLNEERGKYQYSLNCELYGEFLIRLFKTWKKDRKDGKEPFIRRFHNYIGTAFGFLPEACDQRGICSVQNAVEADGSVYPCDFYMLDEYRLGNFNRDSLQIINQRRKEIQFRERSLKLEESCLNCEYYKMCRGGCQRNRVLQEDTGKYQNYFCRSYQMFFEECYEDIMEISRKIQQSRGGPRRQINRQ